MEPLAAAGRTAARRAVSVPARGGCRICRGPVARDYSLCTSCRDVAVALGRPLVPVTPIAIVTASSGLYRALRQYKSATHAVARRQGARLAALLGRFARLHLGDLLDDGTHATVVVPSPATGRPPPHPLAGVATAANLVPVVPWLLPRPACSGSVEHRRPALDAFVASPAVAGRRVLLLDDVYTTEAHLQSAAAALEDAQAAEVHALVIARFARWPLPAGKQEVCSSAWGGPARCAPLPGAR